MRGELVLVDVSGDECDSCGMDEERKRGGSWQRAKADYVLGAVSGSA